MILELDCGNTRIKWRLRDETRISHRGAFPTGDGLNGVVSSELANEPIERVLIGSVLGEDFRKKLVAWSLAYFQINPEFATSEPHCNGVVNGYQQPEKLGVDRWLAVLAAKARTPGACIVVDCGSAITVDLVTAQGEHLGGYIAPGLRLMREALGVNTSAIKLGQIGYPENDFPGRNTVTAIKSAELAMLAGLVIRARAALLNYDASAPAVWVTGGDGEWLASQLGNGQFVEDLVLDGLLIALSPQ